MKEFFNQHLIFCLLASIKNDLSFPSRRRRHLFACENFLSAVENTQRLRVCGTSLLNPVSTARCQRIVSRVIKLCLKRRYHRFAARYNILTINCCVLHFVLRPAICFAPQ
ncbi:hypothetical protein PUN28_010627 [Cardiocondyla obscurior]|uniref:Secreted protein n=1 Tax=Cardiocondyla obscurior TaxID=286306 RepID=A0AAW2FMF3_9HYME